MPNALPFGDIDARAIPYETYQLDLSSDLLTAHLPGATSGMLSEAGYVSFDGGLTQWIPSGRTLPDAARFYLPVSATDPFGNVTTLSYDATGVFVASVEDPLGNTALADTDYRTLAPWRLTDPNGNRVEVASDALGRVVAVAVRGKAAEMLGDTLADPTETYEYITDAWGLHGTPNYVHHRARKQHGGTADWQEARSYSDGSGAIAMVKAQAEPGDYPRLDGSGDVEFAHSSDRWIASGKTVVNNKGNVVKQYEPFFSDGPAYQDEPAIVKWGVTAIVHYDPIGRAVRTDFPDGSYTKTDHAVWRQEAWDQHDTLSDPDNEWRLARATLSGTHPDRLAYEAALVHADTPSRVYLDVLGRPFLSVAHNRTAAPSSDAYYETRTQLDIEGQPLAIVDALGRTCQSYAYSMAGRPLAESNIDAGARQMLNTVLGEPLYRWDARDQRMRVEYDALRRPTHLWLQVGTDPEVLLERRYYGDDAALSDPENDNLLGKLVAIYDQAGLVELGPYDFKGNLLEQARTLATVYDATLDWSALATEPSVEDAKTAALVADLEAETFTEERSYDALNRVVSLIGADASEHLPSYDRSGKLKELAVKVRGAGSATSFVDDIAYDAKGQRLQVEWGNGSTTEYTYDPTTFRLTRLLTTRPSPSATLQDLRYTFDAVGNIARIRDEAQQGVFFGGSFAAPAAVYTYDSVYRLIEASGREHMSIGDVVVDQNDAPLQNLPHANQADAVRNYAERYYYDAVSNILELDHRTPGSPGTIWSRGYTYTSGTNRLASHSAPGGPVSFTHDDHGNMVAMPHLASVAYTPFDQMRHADLGGGGDAYFTYDASGKRVRKLVDTGASLIKERIYLGSCELYRERISGSVDLERTTLHIHDGARRVAMVETLTIDDGAPVGSPVDRVRYQLDNHLGSACLELDGAALVISYEEYHPYGTTSYRAGPNGTEVSAKRYRYNGKERDEETGLYDYGARYYAAWLGRWTTADPLGVQAGLNVYLFCRAGPVNYVDPDGLSAIDVSRPNSDGGPLLSGPAPGPAQAPRAAPRPTPEVEVYGPPAAPEDIYDEPDPTLDEDRVVPFDPSAGSLPNVVHPEAWVPETPFFSGLGTLFDSGATAADRIIGGLKVGILAPLAGAELFVTGVIAAPQLAATEAMAAGEHIGRAWLLVERGADSAVADELLAAGQAGATSVAETASTVGIVVGAAGGSPIVTRGTKAVNLPAWRRIAIDMEHVASGHMRGGGRVSPLKDLFPEHMGMAQVERAVREAYRFGRVVETQGERVLMRGRSASMTIEMWVNRTTKTIETAYPVFK